MQGVHSNAKLDLQTNRRLKMTSTNKLSAVMFGSVLALGSLAPVGQAQAQYYGNDARYGYGQNEQRLRCDSKDGRRNICRPNVRGTRIQMVRQFSKARCTEGYSYGLSRDGMIWVDRGCRADFVVQAGRNNGWRRGDRNDQGNVGYGQQTFRCESDNGRERFCQVDTRGGVQLQRQVSSSPCVQNRTWGVERDGVWVNNGCRAEFAIRSR